MEPFKYNVLPGRYRHFKGNEYEVLGMARHSETEEEMVVYRALCALKRLSNFPDRSAGAMPFRSIREGICFPLRQTPAVQGRFSVVY